MEKMTTYPLRSLDHIHVFPSTVSFIVSVRRFHNIQAQVTRNCYCGKFYIKLILYTRCVLTEYTGRFFHNFIECCVFLYGLRNQAVKRNKRFDH